MNYDKIKRTGILFLLGIGAITSLSCNDNDNGNYPERVPTRLSVMPLPERVDYKESAHCYQRGSLHLLFNGNRTSLGNPDIETSARTSKFLHFRKC